MQLIKDKLIIEIGMNHLGNQEVFKKYIDEIIKNEFKYVTIQIREREYYNSEYKKLLLPHQLIHNQFDRLKNMNIKVGFAIADANFIELTKNYKADFYKILSWKAEDIKLINFVLKYNKPTYISLGTLSDKKIINLSKKISSKSKNLRFIHTQLNYNKDDLNLNFINKLKTETKISISYGHHAKNSITPIILSLAFEIDKIFIYIRLNDKDVFPDNDHAFNIKKMKNTLNELNDSIRYLGSASKNKTDNYIEKLHKER